MQLPLHNLIVPKTFMINDSYILLFDASLFENKFIVHLVTYPFKNGQKLDVIITEVVSPWELWLQPIGSQLDLLMEEMW